MTWLRAAAAPGNVGPLVTELERRGVSRGISEHWLIYPVAILESDERIILGNASDDRYPPYHDAVVAAGPNIERL